MENVYVYETRAFKKGDCVELQPVQLESTYGKSKDFLVDRTMKNLLGSVLSLMYVSAISKDAENIKIRKAKTKPGKYEDVWFPIEIFKIVKVPKMNDVVAWLYDNQPVQYPSHWLIFKNEVQSISRYIPKIFQTNLKAIYLINKECNHLHFNHDSFENLMYYKTIIQQLKLSFYDRYSEFNKMTKRKQFIEACQTINPTWHTSDAISIYEMNNRNVFSNEMYISNDDRLDFWKNPKKKLEFDQNNAILQERIKELAKENNKRKMLSDKRYIFELDQKVIDDLELVIFNVKTLPSRNQILFIFIDKDNNKRFYIEDFSYIFFISNQSSIINNDYIENFDTNKHMPFIVKSLEVLRTIKFAVQDSHKRFMKQGGF